MEEPFDGRTYVADSSAWARSHHPVVSGAWAAALRAGQIAVTPIVTLELLFSTRNGSEFDSFAHDLAQLRDTPLTRSVTNAALGAFRELAHVAPLHHRSVSLHDLLIAASAQDAGLGVLHYDEDFDVLASVLEFESRWIAPRGSL
ncbi:MAG TPA: PIN domain-containing protein [Gaiellaceae bacterium]|nr:PIN domain-containing protein [Gaiellaceae bacterium]